MERNEEGKGEARERQRGGEFVDACTEGTTHIQIWRTQDNMWYIALFIHYVGPRD